MLDKSWHVAIGKSIICTLVVAFTFFIGCLGQENVNNLGIEKILALGDEQTFEKETPDFEIKRKDKVVSKHYESTEEDCPQTSFNFPRLNQISDYIRIKSPIPTMTEASFCGWFTTGSAGYIQGPLISYTTGTENTLLVDGVIYDGEWIMNVFMNDNSEYQQTEYMGGNIDYHMCVTFAITIGRVEIHINGQLFHIVHVENDDPVESGGVFIIGQEQDDRGGGFDPVDVYKGTVKNYMFWNRILDDAEIEAIYNSPCYCPQDYLFALTNDKIQIYGGVAGIPISQC